jgi:hypothetical protein
MARFSDSEVELLVRGANVVAQMQELGLPREEIEAIIKGGAQTLQARANRPDEDGSFRFMRPFQPGKTELRPVAERTGSQEPKRAGTTAPRPEITEAFVNAVVARIRKADEQLKGSGTVANDYGQRTIEQGLKELSEGAERNLEEVGFQNYEELAGRENDRGRAEADREATSGPSRSYAERQEYQRGRLPRFENPRDMGYGGAPGEGTTGRTGGGVNRSAAADTIQQLQQALASGTLSPEKAFQAEKVLRSLSSMANPRAEIQAQRAEARRTIDENPTNEAGAARNRADFLSEVEAERGRRRMGLFPGARRGNEEAALNNLARIDLSPDPIVRDTSLVDNQGQPDYVTMDTTVAGSNTPDTSNNLNAPKAQSATEFVAQQVDATGSGNMFEGRSENVADISGSLGRLDQAIADLSGREVKVGPGRLKRKVTPFSSEMVADIGPIRSVSGLQKAADAILAVGQEAGVNFPQMVFTEGRMKAEQVANPGVGEVLEFLKMNAGDQQRLGVALNQVEAAGNNINAVGITPINAEAKRRFRAGEPGVKRPDVVFGVKNMISANPSRKEGGGGVTPGGILKSPRGDFEMEVDLARMPADKAKRVKRTMRGPEGVGPASMAAQMPFIGAVAGEETPVSYIRGVAANPDYEDVGISAIDDEVRGRVFAGGPDERSVRDAAIRRIIDRGSQDQARRDEIAENMMRMDRRPGRMF